MSDLAYTLMLIGGFVVLTVVLRAAERWCEEHPRRDEVASARVSRDERH
ncbi:MULTISPECIES: hypothetical protein [unclassified Amycolatopsis]|nr:MULTISPECIES: hypothetical protein [unclassified Amycolatopsis]HET6706165.1 hypothetical protein [Amycolatopsis sp.]